MNFISAATETAQAAYPWIFTPTVFGGGLHILFPLSMNFSSMAPIIFTEKIFARIFIDVHGYGTIFLGHIREELVWTIVRQ